MDFTRRRRCSRRSEEASSASCPSRQGHRFPASLFLSLSFTAPLTPPLKSERRAAAASCLRPCPSSPGLVFSSSNGGVLLTAPERGAVFWARRENAFFFVSSQKACEGFVRLFASSPLCAASRADGSFSGEGACLGEQEALESAAERASSTGAPVQVSPQGSFRGVSLRKNKRAPSAATSNGLPEKLATVEGLDRVSGVNSPLPAKSSLSSADCGCSKHSAATPPFSAAASGPLLDVKERRRLSSAAQRRAPVSTEGSDAASRCAEEEAEPVGIPSTREASELVVLCCCSLLARNLPRRPPSARRRHLALVRGVPLQLEVTTDSSPPLKSLRNSGVTKNGGEACERNANAGRALLLQKANKSGKGFSARVLSAWTFRVSGQVE